MKISKYIAFAFIGLLLTNCGETKDDTEKKDGESTENTTKSTVSISGNISAGSDLKIYLYRFGQEKPEFLDSVVTDANGAFSFTKEQNGYEFLGVGPSLQKTSVLLVNNGETINLAGPIDNWGIGTTVTGSENSELITAYNTKRIEYAHKMQTLQAQMQSLDPTDEAAKAALNAEGFDLQAQFDLFKYDFVDKNMNKPAVFAAMSDLQDIIKDYDRLKGIEGTMLKFLPNTLFAKSVTNKLKDADNYLAQQKLQQQQQAVPAGVGIGSAAPELTFNDPNGKSISLSSLKGQVVLLDFWASWCKPCRMENPNVVKLYNEYNEKGFTVYSVSLDNSAAKWKNAIEADGLIWPNHVSDLKGWSSAGAQIYKVNSIPQTYLIDADGKIIASGLRGQALEQKLKEILG